MQVSHLESPTLGLRFGIYFSHKAKRSPSTYLLGFRRARATTTNNNQEFLRSYPQIPAQGSFALNQFVWQTLIHESNKSSKKVFWMTQLLTLEQVAHRLSVSKRSVQRWVKDGRIETIRLSAGVIRIRDKSLERFIDNLQREQRLAQGADRG
jgi:excisionase family DNA binding protein